MSGNLPDNVRQSDIDVLFAGSLSNDVIDKIELRDKLNRDTVSYLETLRRLQPDDELADKYGQFLEDAINELSGFATDLKNDSKKLMNGDYSRPSLRVVGGRDYGEGF